MQKVLDVQETPYSHPKFVSEGSLTCCMDQEVPFHRIAKLNGPLKTW